VLVAVWVTVVGGIVEVMVEYWVRVVVAIWVETSVTVFVVNPPFIETAAIIKMAPTISPMASRATPLAGPDAFRCKITGIQFVPRLIRPMANRRLNAN
jgi:hypothetical protein